MDDEKRKRRQSLKVIVSEAIMVLTVIATVTVLAFIVSGYWLNSDFEVERQGMLQVSSIPTGADLDIDGESSWLQRTNTSKVLPSGEHKITLSKEGYDTWTKTINISDGLLYRLHYPRLFLQNRKTEKVFNPTGATFASVSPNREKLLVMNSTTEWQLINLNSDSITHQKLNLAEYLPDVSLAENATVGLFSGQILDIDWDQNNSHVLLKINTENGIEWMLLDVNNVKNSLNLSKEFGANFSKMVIFDDSANNLLAVQNGNLHKIDISEKLISAILIKNIVNFDYYDNEIVFVSSTNSDKYTVGSLKIGDEKTKELEVCTDPVKVALFRFYDDMYIAVLDGDTILLYQKSDFTLVSSFELGFTPNSMIVGHNGEFITMNDGTKIATLDMESSSVREWTIEDNFGWLDNNMLYTVTDGTLVVYDFDGLNRRVLAKNASHHFPVTITNDKWLYYFNDGQLVREWLIEK